MIESEETAEAETAAGYAKEMSEDYRRRQAQLVTEHIAKQDIVITTALIPGRPAPILVTQGQGWPLVAATLGISVLVLVLVSRDRCRMDKSGLS